MPNILISRTYLIALSIVVLILTILALIMLIIDVLIAKGLIKTNSDIELLRFHHHNRRDLIDILKNKR